MLRISRLKWLWIVLIAVALLVSAGCGGMVPGAADVVAPAQEELARAEDVAEQEPLAPAQDVPDVPLPQAAPGVFDPVGIWTSEEVTAYGTVYAETILERTRTYSHMVRWSDLMTYEVGEYQVLEGAIHFSVRDYEPKVYKGTEMSRPLSWTVRYTVVDENTMIWEDRIMQTRWEVHRRPW